MEVLRQTSDVSTRFSDGESARNLTQRLDFRLPRLPGTWPMMEADLRGRFLFSRISVESDKCAEPGVWLSVRFFFSRFFCHRMRQIGSSPKLLSTGRSNSRLTHKMTCTS